MKKRTLIKLIILYLILITLIAIALICLLSSKLNPAKIYVCEDGSISENLNDCPISLHFENPGEKIIFLNRKEKKQFEACTLNISGTALQNQVSFDIGSNNKIDFDLVLYQDIDTDSLDSWSKGESNGGTEISISDKIREGSEGHSIKQELKEANVSWIQYNFNENITLDEFDSLTFWSRCINYSNPSEDFERWNIHLYDSNNNFICSMLDYTIQDEDGSWKSHMSNLCSESKNTSTSIRYLRIYVDQSNSMSAVCFYSDMKIIGSFNKKLEIDPVLLNNYEDSAVPIKIRAYGKGDLIIRPSCSYN